MKHHPENIVIVSSAAETMSRQRLPCSVGISRDTAGATATSMNLVIIQPGGGELGGGLALGSHADGCAGRAKAPGRAPYAEGSRCTKRPQPVLGDCGQTHTERAARFERVTTCLEGRSSAN